MSNAIKEMTLAQLAVGHSRIERIMLTTRDGSMPVPDEAVKMFLLTYATEPIRWLDGCWCSVRSGKDYVAFTITVA